MKIIFKDSLDSKIYEVLNIKTFSEHVGCSYHIPGEDPLTYQIASNGESFWIYARNCIVIEEKLNVKVTW